MGFLGWICLTCLNSAFSQGSASSQGLSTAKTPGCLLWKIPWAPMWQKALRIGSVVRGEAGCGREGAYHVWHLTFKERRGSFKQLKKGKCHRHKNQEHIFWLNEQASNHNLSSDFKCHTRQLCVCLRNKCKHTAPSTETRTQGQVRIGSFPFGHRLWLSFSCLIKFNFLISVCFKIIFSVFVYLCLSLRNMHSAFSK